MRRAAFSTQHFTVAEKINSKLKWSEAVKGMANFDK